MHVADQLRELRQNLNLSQERFGMRLGVSGKSISAYETGRCVPTIKLLKKIANEYDVNFTEMSKENQQLLGERLKALEDCFVQLRTVLTLILPL